LPEREGGKETVSIKEQEKTFFAEFCFNVSQTVSTTLCFSTRATHYLAMTKTLTGNILTEVDLKGICIEFVRDFAWVK
jgi:hypothetical protein